MLLVVVLMLVVLLMVVWVLLVMVLVLVVDKASNLMYKMQMCVQVFISVLH